MNDMLSPHRSGNAERASPAEAGKASPSAKHTRRFSLADRWSDFRNRLAASPRFQRFALSLPFARPIARSRAQEIFNLSAGFVYSQVLLACIRLHLLDRLAEGPKSVDDISRVLNLPREGAERLLRAAASLRLAGRRSGDRYGLGDLGAAIRARPGFAALIEHNALLYSDLADPVALLRGVRPRDGLARYWPYAAADGQRALADFDVAGYSRLMAASQSLIAGEILDVYDFGQHTCLLDVGGGEGAFLEAVSRRAPKLKLVLFDLPAVADRARRRFSLGGIAARASTVGGDFLINELPQGADIISLIRVLLDQDDVGAVALLRKVKHALQPGGVILIAEPLAGTRGFEAMGDAYFGFYLLAKGRGRPRTLAEITTLLTAAGFQKVRQMPTRTQLQTSVVVATA